ncbi:DUF2922 domain-containing protein [Enterococcus sp. AZ109]|uniref:DUF2922 domain-containing protein n=1 Tax=Enterococcus sp. AZ109 TaxID=2774634 RepID=UPI003F29E6B4
MLKLKAVFQDATGKNHHWSFNEPDPNKSPEEIQKALETITTLNLFEKDGVKLFQKVVSAKFVETIETPLFDVKNEPEAYLPDPNNAFVPQFITTEPSAEVETVDPAKMEVAKAVEKVELSEKTSSLLNTEKPSLISLNARDTIVENLAQPKDSDTHTIMQTTDSRKERLERLRQYHEANKKKQNKKKRNKKKKR